MTQNFSKSCPSEKSLKKFSAEILQFDGSEIVSDILAQMPEASEILLAHGLSCASCHLNAQEELRAGILGHGMVEKDVEIILKDLNEAAQELKIKPGGRVSKDPELTKKAAEKVIEFQAEAGQLGWGFKIEVLPDTKGSASYFLDFLEKPEKGDRIVISREIQLFLDPDSLKFLKNCSIDFITESGEAGFKVNRG